MATAHPATLVFAAAEQLTLPVPKTDEGIVVIAGQVAVAPLKAASVTQPTFRFTRKLLAYPPLKHTSLPF